jgi:hypothetical protein
VMLGSETTPLSRPIEIGDHPLEEVSRFKYCGGVVTSDGSAATEIQERTKAATRTFQSLQRQVFRNKQLATKVKINVYRVTVMATLLYGAETWNLTAADQRRLEAFHHGCLRRILRVSYMSHTTNEEIRKRAGLQSIEAHIRQRRLRWAGHVARMTWNRMPKIVMEGKCAGNRPFQGVRKRWIDAVGKDLAGIEDWKDIAADRTKWRETVRNVVTQTESTRTQQERDKRAAKKTTASDSRNQQRGRGRGPRQNGRTDGDGAKVVPKTAKVGTTLRCPHCPFEAGNGGGLSSHIRHKHPNARREEEGSNTRLHDGRQPTRLRPSAKPRDLT